jgi:hypothetical protein
MGDNGKKSFDIHVPRIRTLRVGHDKTDVIWQIEGEKTQRLPWEAAIYFSKAVMAQAKAIEEQVKAEKIISDQAFLFGHGFPIGIATDPRIRNEARKEAVNDPKLRKKGLGMKGIESTEHVGAPTIIQSPPPKKEVKNGEKEL